MKNTTLARNRGKMYWLRPSNLAAAWKKELAPDRSNELRHVYDAFTADEKTVSLDKIISKDTGKGFRILILGDTGEGDASQYSTLPLIRKLNPDMMIINGDTAYPAGRFRGKDRDKNDYLAGFFEPYEGVPFPIWAVPGNHEYYSPQDGKEFYDVFCSDKYDNEYWNVFRIPHIRQPGLYWKIRDANSKLSVIGIDTGKCGNLDGTVTRRMFGGKAERDERQMNWLRGELESSASGGEQVLLLFHIPALVRGAECNPGLSELHGIIAEYGCIRAVICAHEHNYQYYTPEIFGRFLECITGRPLKHKAPEYYINGGGGAFLENTDFGNKDELEYPDELRYPSVEQWRDYSGAFKRYMDKFFNRKSFIIKALNNFLDFDTGRYASMLMIEYRVDSGRIEIVPVFAE